MGAAIAAFLNSGVEVAVLETDVDGMVRASANETLISAGCHRAGLMFRQCAPQSVDAYRSQDLGR